VNKSPDRKKNPAGFFRLLGPGLITGAADDDPSGIATYSQAGAAFGMTLLWTLVLTLPLMVAVQEISARIGRVTGHGLAKNMAQHYSKWITYPIVGLLFVANVFNCGADIAAIGSATSLLIGGPAAMYGLVFGLTSLVLQVFIPYTRYANYLKWLTLSLFAYVATVFAVHVPWADALRNILLPKVSLSGESLMTVVAILGTTISPYLFFWQASLEVEDTRNNKDEKPLKAAPERAAEHLGRIRMDTLIGMSVSNLVGFFIMLTAAVTLHAHGRTEIATAAQAAEALKPVAGKFASLLFSLGIIGTGLLSLPVLVGSAAYAVGEVFRWPIGLQRKVRQAKGFYGVLALAMVLSILLDLAGLDPIKALVFSAAINGIVAVPVLLVIMLMAGNRKIMGKFPIPPVTSGLGWLTTAFMGACGIALLATSIPGLFGHR
jgi:NRAMP (natural resistance-associated macrophage protein)-like metal ion transporter